MSPFNVVPAEDFERLVWESRGRRLAFGSPDKSLLLLKASGQLLLGVTGDEKASLTLLSGEVSKGHITLKAAPDAKPVEKQQIVVMAHVSINFVMKFTYYGEPVTVTVTKL